MASSRLAVLGLGGRVMGMIELMRQLDADARVVAVADPSMDQTRERLTKLGCEDAKLYESADKLLETPERYDGFVIGTRCHLHTPMAMKVAATGRPRELPSK